MPYWEDELETLLASLGVSLEFDPSQSFPNPTDLVQSEEGEDEPSTDDDRASLVNKEVEAMMREVARLAKSGALDLPLRDDVLNVLRALARSSSLEDTEGAEWDLVSSSAVLHFCRIVLRLTRALSNPNHG